MPVPLALGAGLAKGGAVNGVVSGKLTGGSRPGRSLTIASRGSARLREFGTDDAEKGWSLKVFVKEADPWSPGSASPT